jgi:hypothetical protein
MLLRSRYENVAPPSLVAIRSRAPIIIVIILLDYIVTSLQCELRLLKNFPQLLVAWVDEFTSRQLSFVADPAQEM